MLFPFPKLSPAKKNSSKRYGAPVPVGMGFPTVVVHPVLDQLKLILLVGAFADAEGISKMLGFIMK